MAADHNAWQVVSAVAAVSAFSWSGDTFFQQNGLPQEQTLLSKKKTELAESGRGIARRQAKLQEHGPQLTKANNRALKARHVMDHRLDKAELLLGETQALVATAPRLVPGAGPTDPPTVTVQTPVGQVTKDSGNFWVNDAGT